MYQLALEPVRPVGVVAVVDEEVADIEVLVVGEDEPLARGVAEMLPHPAQLVAPGRGVLPRGGGEDVGIKEQGGSLNASRAPSIGSTIRRKMPGASS
ncbi:hypothetical protein Plut_0738 [Pelodictyon luteolum DSM 273]|uniref:Uncharacterized protein n=1 Tax=Chlorobium luteolum (strain DSM 273 / BCRC 81028 / 2530) TaxID=319225 RepID=Q3B4W8_CHLL3|nr:hypothetical protein Plut_0738 [Pelodictyon luteolum DSM 273]